MIENPERRVGFGTDCNQEWEPSIKVRPHHLTDPEIKGAVIGKKTILALNLDGPRLINEFPNEVALYHADTYGVGNSGDEVIKPLKNSLSALEDDDVVHLDIDKDDICNSCQIGKHCMATNYRLWGKTRQRDSIDKEEVDKINQNLIVAGFVEGQDFIFSETSYEFLDYGGAGLWEDAVPSPRTIIFNSMLVKMYALRKIFAR